MKNIFKAVLILLTSATLYSQHITNTLGSSGIFKIKDAGTTFLSLSQTDGLIDISKNIRLNVSTSSQTGVIMKGGGSFIHDYAPVGSIGHNTFMGFHSGNFTLQSGAVYNTAVGFGTLASLTTGINNTAVGSSSLLSNTSGEYNSAFGSGTLTANTTGSYNTCFGSLSLYSNTTGDGNCAFGPFALQGNLTGTENSAFGVYSLTANTTGINNTAFGNYTLMSNTTGNQNLAFGYSALQDNSIGYANTSIGFNSMNLNTIGAGNTSIGALSLTSNTTGQLNTVIGYQSGSNIISGSNVTLIGYNTEPTSGTVSNQITLGNNSVTSLRCNVTTITSLSDARDKKNIHDLNLGLEFISKLKPRIYNWDKREWYDDNISDGSKMQEVLTAGFIAQELDEVQTTENAEWLNLVLKDNPEKWEATPGNLLPVMVKAIQELSERLLAVKEENDKLRSEVNDLSLLNNKITELEKMLKEVKQNSYSSNDENIQK